MIESQLPLLPLILDAVPQGLRQALAQEGVPFRDRRPGFLDGRFVLFDSRICGRCTVDVGQAALDVHELREPGEPDLFAALTNERSARFEWRLGGMTLSEEIARVDRRAARRRLMERLRELVEVSGGVWLGVAPFPFPYRSAFNFRIDYDDYEPADFDAALRAVAGQEQATSHFVCGAAYEPAPEALRRLKGLDVGSHGYWHHTYRTLEENLRNVGRGIDVLRAVGIEPYGFAAPHGRYNRGLAEALAALDVTYSSEFALAYDALPFFPGSSGVLQVPIHPVCLGLFLEAARRKSDAAAVAREPAAVEAAVRYFRQEAQARYRAGEPIFFYAHPTRQLGRYPQVLHHLLETVSEFGALWRTTLGEFSRWWRVRAGVRLSVTRALDRYVVRAEGHAGPYRPGIEYWRGEHVALMPLDGGVLTFAPQALAYQRRATRRAFRPVRVDRPEGLRGHVRRLLDWERVTPVEEIGSGDWRNWAKRTLRRWWG